MNQLNEFKQNLYKIKVQTLVTLLDDLRSALFNYIRIFKKIRFQENKYGDFKLLLEDAQEKIIDIYNKTDKFFNDGFFLELKKEDAKDISNEYQYVVQEFLVVVETIEDDYYKQFIDLISFYEKTILPGFERLNDNIDIYNNVATVNNWQHKLITYEEAFNYHQNNRNLIYSRGIGKSKK